MLTTSHNALKSNEFLLAPEIENHCITLKCKVVIVGKVFQMFNIDAETFN